MCKPVLFSKWANIGPFLLFSFFSNTNFIEKTIGFSRIQTWIVGAEGEHADHSTTTTALVFNMFILPRYLDQIDYFNDKTKWNQSKKVGTFHSLGPEIFVKGIMLLAST